MALGGIVVAVGFYLTSFTAGLWHLYIFYGVFCGFAVGMCYNCLLTILPLWHPKRVGFINGAMLMVYGFASLILGNPISAVINAMGWRTAFKVLAVVFLALFLILSVFMQTPDTTPRFVQSPADGDSANDVSTLDMLKSRKFWLFFIWECMVGAVGLALIGHAAAIASDVFTPAAWLAIAVGSVSAASGIGRLICGILSDAIGDIKTAIFMNIAGLAGCIMLIFCLETNSMALLFAGFILCGMCFGAGPALNASFTRRTFGSKYFSTNFSVMSFSLLFSSIAGTYLVGIIRSASDTYMTAFLLILVYLITGLGALGIIFVKSVRAERSQRSVLLSSNIH